MGAVPLTLLWPLLSDADAECTQPGGAASGHPLCAPAPFEVSGDVPLSGQREEPFVLLRQGSGGPADNTWDPGVKLTL